MFSIRLRNSAKMTQMTTMQTFVVCLLVEVVNVVFYGCVIDRIITDRDEDL